MKRFVTAVFALSLCGGAAAMAQEQPASPPTTPPSSDSMPASASPSAPADSSMPAASTPAQPPMAASASPPPGGYPPCSASVHDGCVQRGHMASAKMMKAPKDPMKMGKKAKMKTPAPADAPPAATPAPGV